jgi:hypothetical protein
MCFVILSFSVVDGDIVSGVPKTGYKHSGTEIIVDALGAGSIIIDPSFVEKMLRTSNKTSMSVHSLVIYRRGLQGVKAATEYTRARMATRGTARHGDGTELENALIGDEVRLAFESGEMAVKYAIEAEERINSALAAAYAMDPSSKHDREVAETNAMAENVRELQKGQLEKMYDTSKGMYSSVKKRSSMILGWKAEDGSVGEEEEEEDDDVYVLVTHSPVTGAAPVVSEVTSGSGGGSVGAVGASQPSMARSTIAKECQSSGLNSEGAAGLSVSKEDTVEGVSVGDGSADGSGDGIAANEQTEEEAAVRSATEVENTIAAEKATIADDEVAEESQPSTDQSQV